MAHKSVKKIKIRQKYCLNEENDLNLRDNNQHKTNNYQQTRKNFITMNGIKIRLALMNFLQFAIWGTYLISLGKYLSSIALGADIPWFYSVQGIVSIFMPAIIGVVGDKYIQPQKLLGMCHLLAAAFMGMAYYYCVTTSEPQFGTLFTYYTLSVGFYMPTIALSNTVAFSILKQNGLDTVKDFPPIRVFGTVGFVAAMWFVNSAYLHDGNFGLSLSVSGRFQDNELQLATCAIVGIVLSIYAFMLPKCPLTESKDNQTWVERFGLDAFALFKTKKMAIFFIFSMLLGVSLQITNAYASSFISQFSLVDPESAIAKNSTLIISISQISEALCILLITFFLKRYGIKKVMMIAMFAWVLRFGFFGLATDVNAWWFIPLIVGSMIVYGVAFDFFNVSGALFVSKESPEKYQSSAQGLFMLMTNGIGATVGTQAAGLVVNHYCKNEGNYMTGDWSTVWLIFSAYALVVFLLFTIFFKYKHVPEKD